MIALHAARGVMIRLPAEIESRAEVASRTRSFVYAIGNASSKSLIPQINRPSASRHVPKFSVCRSPTASTFGAFASSGHVASHTCTHR